MIGSIRNSSATLPILTIGSHTYTANTAGHYVIDGQTLVPGGAAIIESGTLTSLAPSACCIVVGDSTETLSSTMNLRGLILQGFGDSPDPSGLSSTASIPFFTEVVFEEVAVTSYQIAAEKLDILFSIISFLFNYLL